MMKMILEDILDGILSDKFHSEKLVDASDSVIFEKLSSLGVTSAEIINAIEEIIINAREHGQNHFELFFIMHGEDLIFGARDFGPGIHETLPQNKRLSDTRGKKAAALIRLALEEGITGTGIIGRGVGLFFVSDYVARAHAELLVCSDGGLVLQDKKLFSEKERVSSVQGTIVLLKVRIK